MTANVFEDDRSFTVNSEHSNSFSTRDIKFEVYNDGDVVIEIDNGPDERAMFCVSAEQATAIKEFFAKRGY